MADGLGLRLGQVGEQLLGVDQGELTSGAGKKR
jgi:hypothetical protein